MDKTILFVGAGFSAAANIPTTKELLLNFTNDHWLALTPANVQDVIGEQLREYWKKVFGWAIDSDWTPTFEDHFTVLDLAANSGHHLGAYYSPRSLRAIRRLSLHRVFETLDQDFRFRENIASFVGMLHSGQGNAVISTNWDIVIERHLQKYSRSYDYGIPIESLVGGERPTTGLKLLKLHGSANWCYCDSCRRLFEYSPDEGKGTYKSGLFLELRDFVALMRSDDVRQQKIGSELAGMTGVKLCPHCSVRLSARVATFSFEKALGFYQFQGIWEEALRVLREAHRWLFIGYSLPEADFELRHLLKTAQLAGGDGRNLKIEIVLKDDQAAELRFRRFFGSEIDSISTDGFDTWVSPQI